MLLRLLSLAGADSVRGFQIGMVVVAILTCLAAYLLGRALAGPVAGLTASALLTVAPPFPLFAHRVLADLPPLGLALVSFWLAVLARQRRSAALAAGGGGALALAATVKPNALLALPPFLLLLLWERFGRLRYLAAATAGAALVGAAFAVAYRDVLGELWESVVVYHRDARDTPDVIDKTHELVTFLNWRTPFAWLVVAGLGATVLLLRRRGEEDLWSLWSWAAISVAFLVYHHPLHYNHLLVLPVVLALPAAIALAAVVTRTARRNVAIGALALALVAAYVQQQRRIVLDQVSEEADLVRAAEIVRRETEPDDLVVSDHSIVPFIADRRVAGPLVDTAALRFETGSLSDAEVLQVLEQKAVTAVVVGRAFASRRSLVRDLDRRFPQRFDAGSVTVYVR